MKKLILTILVIFCASCCDHEGAVREAERRIDDRHRAQQYCTELGACLNSRVRFEATEEEGNYRCVMIDVLEHDYPATWDTKEFSIASLSYVCDLKDAADKKGKKK